MKKRISVILALVLVCCFTGHSLAAHTDFGNFAMFFALYNTLYANDNTYTTSVDEGQYTLEKGDGEAEWAFLTRDENVTIVLAGDNSREDIPLHRIELRSLGTSNQDYASILASVVSMLRAAMIVSTEDEAASLLAKMDLGVENKFDGGMTQDGISYTWSMWEDDMFSFVMEI